MFSKIYLALLGLSISVMAFFTYYSWSWLQSIGQPAAAVAEFQFYTTLVSTALWISTAVLLVLANAVLWSSGRAWAIWTTLLFFTVFAVLRYFGLELAYIDFQMRTYPAGIAVMKGPVIGVALIILMAAIAFFDQFIVVRLRAKTYAKPEEPVVETVETPAD